MTKLQAILKKIESTPEYRLRKIMGRDYIDTPGFCHTKQELKNYGNIQECVKLNMEESEYKKLLNWIKNNPKKIKLI